MEESTAIKELIQSCNEVINSDFLSAKYTAVISPVISGILAFIAIILASKISSKAILKSNENILTLEKNKSLQKHLDMSEQSLIDFKNSIYKYSKDELKILELIEKKDELILKNKIYLNIEFNSSEFEISKNKEKTSNLKLAKSLIDNISKQLITLKDEN